MSLPLLLYRAEWLRVLIRPRPWTWHPLPGWPRPGGSCGWGRAESGGYQGMGDTEIVHSRASSQEKFSRRPQKIGLATPNDGKALMESQTDFIPCSVSLDHDHPHQKETRMLRHPTLSKLQTLRLPGMARALEQQFTMPDMTTLSFEERLGLLVDQELTERDNRRLTTCLRKAKLRQSAVLEDLQVRPARGVDKALMTRLATCQWIRDHHNLVLTGPTGTGKTWIACALAHTVCRAGYPTLYLRVPRLIQDLHMAKGDGRYKKLLASYAKVALLVLDDIGLAPLTGDQGRDLLEIVEDRQGRRSTLVTSQLPVDHWHSILGEPTVADAILDRLVHDAYRITLKGESMRKRKTPLT